MSIKRMFVLDTESETQLAELASADDRSKSAEVRHLINAEWERRQLRRIRAGFHADPLAAESDATPASH